jgi:hypothetical protein
MPIGLARREYRRIGDLLKVKRLVVVSRVQVLLELKFICWRGKARLHLQYPARKWLAANLTWADTTCTPPDRLTPTFSNYHFTPSYSRAGFTSEYVSGVLYLIARRCKTNVPNSFVTKDQVLHPDDSFESSGCRIIY